MFLLTFGLLLVVIFIIHQYVYGYWKRRGIPYIEPHLLYGNLKGFVNRDESFALSAANLYYKSEKPVVGVYFFFRPGILIRDADLAKKVLVTDFQNFYDRGVHSNEKLSPLSAKYTNDVIVSIFFGLDVDSFKDDANIFAEFRDKCNTKDFIINLTMATVFFYPKLFDFLKLYRFSNQFMTMMGDIIQKTIQSREENNIQRNDFLQMLMQLQKAGELEGDENGVSPISGKKVKLSMHQIVAQTLLFFLAGSDTTAITIACCLHELTQNEEVMQKLKEDINKALEKHNGVISYESIQEMEYLDMVIQEAARKYPALPVLNRICTKPFKVPDSDIVIEKDTQLIISVLGFHRDPKYFPDPMKFEPERFREGSERFNANAYIPFGDGPRTCIGMRQAKISAKIAIVRMLTKFELSALEKREIEFDNYATSLKAKGGIKLKISKHLHES